MKPLPLRDQSTKTPIQFCVNENNARVYLHSVQNRGRPVILSLVTLTNNLGPAGYNMKSQEASVHSLGNTKVEGILMAGSKTNNFGVC